MSFREKNAWIAVVTTLIVWGYYFSTVWSGIAARSLDGQAIFNLFLVCMGITVVLMLGLNLVAARVAKQKFGAPDDELERSVDARALRFTHGLLGWLLLGIAASCPWLADWSGTAFPADPAGSLAIIVANAIILVCVATEVLREIIHIVHYRLMA
jgi:hypothetical protein